MAMLFICIVFNAYSQLVLHHILMFLKPVNIIAPFVVLFYLSTVIPTRGKPKTAQ